MSKNLTENIVSENDQYLFCFYMDTFLLFNFFYSGKKLL